MTATASGVVRARNWHGNGLRIILWIMVVLSLTVMGGLPGLLAPWAFLGSWPGHEFPEVHRWHDAQWGAMFAILFGGSLIMLLRGVSTRPLLVQFLVFATAAMALLNTPFDPLILSGLIVGVFGPMAAIAALYPQRAHLLTLRVPRGQTWNWPLVVISVLTAAGFVGSAWQWYSVQLLRLPDEHSQFQHWTIAASLCVVLLGAGLLAATRRPGARDLGVIAGIALVYLGIAAMAVPDHPGSWGASGGVLSLLAGVGYIALSLEVLPRAINERFGRGES